MNILATDIDVPVSQIVSNSPTHSLPDVSYLVSEAVASSSAPGKTTELTSIEVPGVPLSMQEQSMEVCPSGEFSSSIAIPLPVLQRAVSTSPRLEHISNDTRPTEGAAVSHDTAENDLLFFLLLDKSQDVEKSVSLSSGCLHEQNGNVGTRNDVRASDTVLSTGTAPSHGQVSSPSLERLRSGLRRMMHIRSQPNDSNVACPENARRYTTRNDSTISSRSGTGHWYGSSIFGSKLFESASTSSFGSQRIHIVAGSPSIEPAFISCYSTSCDDSSFPRTESSLDSRYAWHTSRFRTTSASSDIQSTRLSAEHNMSLQRTQSLPSRHGASTACEFRDEVTDNVSELPHVAATSGSTTKRKWQMTMPELTEASENSTLSSHGQKREHLAAAALAIIRGEYRDSSEAEQDPDTKTTTNNSATPVLDIRLEKRRYLKNLIVLSIAYFFLFSAYFALRNLQSSLNAVAGLGLYALSSMYLSLVFGSLCSTMIVQRLQPKRTLSLSLVGFVMYSAANFYPRFYTMIPASVAHGFFMAIGYTAHTTYLANISAGYADLLGKQMKHVLSQFHGTYFIFLQFSQIAGGLISSLLLSKPVSHLDGIAYAGLIYANDSNNSLSGDVLNGSDVYADGVSAASCGSSSCPSDGERVDSNSNVDEITLLILMGCFGACTIIGCIVLVLFLDPLEGIMNKSTASFAQQMTAVFRFFLERRALLVVGLSFYTLLQVTFMFGEFTKVINHASFTLASGMRLLFNLVNV